MELTSEILKRTCKAEVVGDFYPYNTGDWNKTENYIRSIVDRIDAIKTLKLKADFNHFGSGTSSFVEVYAIKMNGSSSTTVKAQKDGSQIITESSEGLLVAISRVAPVAVIGSDKREFTIRNGNFSSAILSHMQCDAVDKIPIGDWFNEINQIKRIIAEYNIQLLDRSTINKPLDFTTTIKTVLNSSLDYKVFDALFYWED